MGKCLESIQGRKGSEERSKGRNNLERVYATIHGKYIGDVVRDLRLTQFENLSQNNISMLEYENEFDRLVRYVPLYHGMEEQKARRFIRGL